MTFYKTTITLLSKNYPYGFRLKTDKIDYLEFDSKKGFRHCSKTINPKTGLENKPKKSTYNDIILLGRDEIGHVKALHLSFYDQKDIDNIIKVINDNFDLFTSEQIEYIYIRFMGYIKTSIYAQVVYCGTKQDELMPLYDKPMTVLLEGVKSKGQKNILLDLVFDWDKINSLKVEGYKPFKVVSYGV